MAKDKIKPLKIETDVDGTELDFLPTEANPQEDYVSTKGIVLENNEDRCIDLDTSGNIQFQDAIETVPVTVRELRTAENNILDISGKPFLNDNLQGGIEELRKQDIITPESTASTLNGSKVLTYLSNSIQVISGTQTGYSVVLPNATTLFNGMVFKIINTSSESVLVKNNGSTTLLTLSAGSTAELTLYENSTSNGLWDISIIALNSFSLNLHYISGTGAGTIMYNGSFFRVSPGTFSSGSYSGYASSFPLQIPYQCQLSSIILTFTSAAFDWNAVSGSISFDIELRDHTYNGSSVLSLIRLSFGNFIYSGTGTSTWRYEIKNFTYISGTPTIDYGKMLGCRFVKSTTGARDINNFKDIIVKLNFQEVR